MQALYKLRRKVSTIAVLTRVFARVFFVCWVSVAQYFYGTATAAACVMDGNEIMEGHGEGLRSRTLTTQSPVLSNLSAAMEKQTGEPFDFNYYVEGKQYFINVFNDGRDTYLHLANGLAPSIVNTSLSQRGAYYVIPGLPMTIQGLIKNDTFKISWKGKQRPFLSAEKEGRHQAAWRVGNDQWAHIVFNKGIPDAGMIDPMRLQHVNLIDALRYVVPATWQAYAESEVDLTQEVTLKWEYPILWLDVLHQILRQHLLYAEVDSDHNSVTLRANPHRGAIFFHHTQALAESRSTAIDSKALSSTNLLHLFAIQNLSKSSAGILIQRRSNSEPLRVIDAETQLEVQGDQIGIDAILYPRLSRVTILHPSGAKLLVRTIHEPEVRFDPTNTLGLKSVSIDANKWQLHFDRLKPRLMLYDDVLRPLEGKWSDRNLLFQSDRASIKLFDESSQLDLQVSSKERLVWQWVD